MVAVTTRSTAVVITASQTQAPDNHIAIGQTRSLYLRQTVENWGMRLAPPSNAGALSLPVPKMDTAPAANSRAIRTEPRYVQMPVVPGAVNSAATSSILNIAPPGSTILQVVGMQVPQSFSFTAEQQNAIVSALKPGTILMISNMKDDRSKVMVRTMMLNAFHDLQSGNIKPSEFNFVVASIFKVVQNTKLSKLAAAPQSTVPGATTPVPGATTVTAPPVPSSTQATRASTKATVDPLPYLQAVGGEGLSIGQLKTINRMLEPTRVNGKIIAAGSTKEAIVEQLAAGWRPAGEGVPKGNPRQASDQTLRISARTTFDIAKSQVLDSSHGMTLFVVSNTDKPKYDALFKNNKNVRIVVGENKQDDVINRLYGEGVMQRVGRIVSIGGAGPADVAKGLSTRFEKGRFGEVVIIPTVISTTTLATPFVVTGREAKVTLGYSAVRVILPINDVANAMIQNDSPSRRMKAVNLSLGGGGGDLQGVISQQLQNRYNLSKVSKPGQSLTALQSNQYAKGSLRLNSELLKLVPEIVTNPAATPEQVGANGNKGKLSSAVALITAGLFEYGNEAVATGSDKAAIAHLQNMVGAEHEFFNATNGTALGGKANHGELVAMGTLLQAQAFGRLTGDYSVYNALLPTYQRLGIPTSAADLTSRGINISEIAEAIRVSVIKNRTVDETKRGLGGQSDSLMSAWNRDPKNGRGVNSVQHFEKLVNQTFR